MAAVGKVVLDQETQQALRSTETQVRRRCPGCIDILVVKVRRRGWRDLGVWVSKGRMIDCNGGRNGEEREAEPSGYDERGEDVPKLNVWSLRMCVCVRVYVCVCMPVMHLSQLLSTSFLSKEQLLLMPKLTNSLRLAGQ